MAIQVCQNYGIDYRDLLPKEMDNRESNGPYGMSNA